MAQFRDFYKKEVVPALTQQFGYDNPMRVPKISKVVLNMGLGEAVADKKILENATADLQQISGQKVVITKAPIGRDVLAYIHDLFESVRPPGLPDTPHVHKMKKYMNFIGAGLDSDGSFLHQIRRTSTPSDFFRVCHDALDHDRAMPLIPNRILEPISPPNTDPDGKSRQKP